MNLQSLVQLRQLYAEQTNSKLHFSPVTFRKGIGAAAYNQFTDSIRVDPPQPGDTQAIIFCDIVHQSAHAYQRHQLGLIRYLLYKTFNRKGLQKYPTQTGLNAVEWYSNREYNNVKKLETVQDSSSNGQKTEASDLVGS